MAKITVTKGIVETFILLVIVSLISPINANWYGKRGKSEIKY